MARLLALFCLLVCGLAVDAQDTYPVFFVSPQGDDSWSGTLPGPAADSSDGPFKTLARAQEALRAIAGPDGHAQGATVHLREGVYTLTAPLVFGPQDSGSDGAPVMWRNFQQENVRIIGALPVQHWEDHEGPVRKASLEDILPAGSRPSALYFEGKRQTLARWPNAGEGDLPGGGWTFVKARRDEAPKKEFYYSGDRPARWSNPAALELSIWPNYNWWQTITPGTVDPASGLVTLPGDLPYTIEPGRRFFFQNVREELDAPGEWWCDTDSGTLYFWPPEDKPDAEILIPVAKALFQLEAAHDINLWGFTLEMTSGEAVNMKNAHRCILGHSIVRNVDGFGVVVDGGTSCRIRGNDIYETGEGGISLTGGDRATLSFGNHHAINNHIHHFGVLHQTYVTGVNVNGVGNFVQHNLIHDAPHIGILLTGNEHLIEYNELHHVCMQGSDNGGFYMGRDWTQRGNKIRFNKFHDIYGFGLAGLGPDKDGVYQYESPHQAWGVYLDDCTSGTLVYGNWFYRVPLCGVMIGGGRDNVVENNVFVECIPALHIDDRWDAYPWDIMHERLQAMKPDQPPYSEWYPELMKMGDDPRKPENNKFIHNVVYYESDSFRGLSTTARHEGGAVVYNFDQFDPATTVVDHNIIYHGGSPVRIAWSEYGKPDSGEILSWEEWRRKGFDESSLITDPMFVDPENDDYTFKLESPVEGTGFKPIMSHIMGLIEDEFRVSPVPPRDERRDGVQHQRFPVRVE
jgi:hypothetical protein